MYFYTKWGNKTYTDRDLQSYYDDFMKAWDVHERYPNIESDSHKVIAAYNEYYYRMNSMKEEVRRHMNPSFWEKVLDNMSNTNDMVHYECRFSRSLPHREEVIQLIKQYGEYTFNGHKFVISY